MLRTTSVLSLALLAAPQAALACGGFFCNREPVDQSKEAIVFAIDEEEGQIEMHVQVSYEGAASEFAWVVPTPTQPHPFLSTEALFAQLELRTAPQLRLTTYDDGDCLQREHTGWYSSDSAMVDSDRADSGASNDSGAPDPGVLVVAREDVGPYATVTLQATDDAALLTWLQDEGYDLPSELGPALRPYLAHGAYLLALKLRNNASAGEIAPLGLTYAGRRPMIPITLTRIAATDDMRLIPYVLSSSRAVPTNYLHVVPDEARFNWLQPWDSRYRETVSAAADEAGGHAFATDFSGAASVMANTIVRPGTMDLQRLGSRPTLVSFMEELLFRQGFQATETLLSILREHVPMPQSLASRGVSDLNFYNCPSCYRQEYDALPYAPAAIVADLDERIVTPAQRAQDLFSAHSHLTRLTSSMSPSEMDLDPMFSINPDLPDVGQIRAAQLAYLCDPESSRSEVPRRLELADGREILLPSQDDWSTQLRQGQTWDTYSRTFSPNAALRVEQLKEEGPPEPVLDNEPGATDALDQHNAGLIAGLGLDPGVVNTVTPPVVSACGCDGGPRGAWAGLGLVGLLALRRRR